MKIIKIVHQDGDIEAERQLSTIKSFDLENFLRANGSCIEDSAYGIADVVAVGLIKDLPTPVYQATTRTLLELAIKNITSSLLQDICNQLQKLEVLTLQAARGKYPKTHNLSVGTYTIHPQNEKMLTPLENFHSRLALDKDNELIDLLRKMGAKVVRITESGIQQNSGSGGLNSEVVVFNLEGKASPAQRIAKGKELTVIFQGDTGDFEDDMLKQSLWFHNDPQLTSIYLGRLPSNQNKILKYTVKNTYTETFDFDFDLAVKYLAFKTDLKGEYHSLSQKERFFDVDFSD